MYGSRSQKKVGTLSRGQTQIGLAISLMKTAERPLTFEFGRAQRYDKRKKTGQTTFLTLRKHATNSKNSLLTTETEIAKREVTCFVCQDFSVTFELAPCFLELVGCADQGGRALGSRPHAPSISTPAFVTHLASIR